jgi:hypothetical protein
MTSTTSHTIQEDAVPLDDPLAATVSPILRNLISLYVLLQYASRNNERKVYI